MTLTLTNRLFDEVFTNWYEKPRVAVDYRELEDSYEYYVPLPGFKKENIKASILDNEVEITARQGEDTASYGFALPEGVDPSKVSAKNENGLLTIKVNKAEEAKSVSIEIT